MTAIERFFQFLEAEGLKHTRVEKELGLSNGYLGKMLARKASIGSEIIEKIVSKYDRLSKEWLLIGKGEMYTKNVYLNVDLNVDLISKMAGNSAGNSENADLNEGSYPKTWDETGACTEEFPADKGNGCENCKKLETDIFVLRDNIKGKILTIDRQQEKIEDFSRQIGGLEFENKQLKAQNATLIAQNDNLIAENANLKKKNTALQERLEACHCVEEESPLSNAV